MQSHATGVGQSSDIRFGSQHFISMGTAEMTISASGPTKRGAQHAIVIRLNNLFDQLHSFEICAQYFLIAGRNNVNFN